MFRANGSSRPPRSRRKSAVSNPARKQHERRPTPISVGGKRALACVFAEVETAIAAIARGEFVLVIDDEQRRTKVACLLLPMQ